MARRLFDLVVPGYVSGFLDIECATIRSVDPRDYAAPCLRLDQVIEPQAALLIVSVRLAKAHLRWRESGQVHPIVHLVMQALRKMRVIAPDIIDVPIIDWVHVVKSLGDLRGVAFSGEHFLVPYSDGAKAIQTFICSDADKSSSPNVAREPLAE